MYMYDVLATTAMSDGVLYMLGRTGNNNHSSFELRGERILVPPPHPVPKQIVSERLRRIPLILAIRQEEGPRDT
jgi:hypothetical protein